MGDIETRLGGGGQDTLKDSRGVGIENDSGRFNDPKEDTQRVGPLTGKAARHRIGVIIQTAYRLQNPVPCLRADGSPPAVQYIGNGGEGKAALLCHIVNGRHR